MNDDQRTIIMLQAARMAAVACAALSKAQLLPDSGAEAAEQAMRKIALIFEDLGNDERAAEWWAVAGVVRNQQGRQGSPDL